MRYSVIAIEREFASGGREIGERLAEKLGVPCYGQEILEKAAEKMGLPVSELRELEESMTSSLLFGLNMLVNITSGRNAELTMAQKLAIAESGIIRELSLHPCVIIGRGAAGILKDNNGVLKVFVHADDNERIQRATEVYGIDPKHAESAIRSHDRRRIGYFKTTTGVEWKDENIYHMFLNSGKLGMDRAVECLNSLVQS